MPKADAPHDHLQKSSLGTLPFQLSLPLGLGAMLVGASLACMQLGSPVLASSLALGALCLLVGGILILPLLVDRSVRNPLLTLVKGMTSLTTENADDLIRLSRRRDAVGDVARASILLLERYDHVEGIAKGVRDSQSAGRELQKTAELLRQGQSQIAHCVLGTAGEVEALRRTVGAAQASLTDVFAAAADDARRELEALQGLRGGLIFSGSAVQEAAELLRREVSNLGAHRTLAGAAIDGVTRDLSIAARALETQIRMLGPDGHDIAAALFDIGDRRASFVQTVEHVTMSAMRLDDLVRRVDRQMTAAFDDTGSGKADDGSIGQSPGEIAFDALVGRVLPAANEPDSHTERGAA